MMLAYDLDFSEIASILQMLDEPTYRVTQIWEGIYCNFWNSLDQFTNLPASLRSKLAEKIHFNALFPVDTLISKDKKTVKTLFRLQDNQLIESVLMRYDKRNTLCISTQVGCAMGCVFCATGQMGFLRHLTSGEIVGQVIHYARALSKEAAAVTNVVVMGMGEPFHNYENTMSAIDRLNDHGGFNFGARRFTISTVGLIPAIRRFTAEKRQVNLAISIHAANDMVRDSILPINKTYPVDELINACRNYCRITGRRVTFEWALVQDVNDTIDHALVLVEKLKGMLCHVNAIPLNPTQGYKGNSSSQKRAQAFREVLINNGIPCTIRVRRGIEIHAGCGQLISGNG
jgi:23S rRNA (adenine2503-C2)-methyltransferase